MKILVLQLPHVQLKGQRPRSADATDRNDLKTCRESRTSLAQRLIFESTIRLPLIIALHASRPVYLFIQLMLPIAACVFNVFRVTVYVLTVFLFFSF